MDASVSAAVEGDPQAVERVLASIRPLVVRYCRARVGRQERSFASADDVAQEVCLAVLTALPSYRAQGRPFLAFVYGIMAHKVADAHRAAARNRSEPLDDVRDNPAFELTTEERDILAGERRRAVTDGSALLERVAVGEMIARTSLGTLVAAESRRRSAHHRIDTRAAAVVRVALRDVGMAHQASGIEPETNASPGQRAMQDEVSRRMRQLLDVLPDKQREILVLRGVVGLSAEETAEAVGSTPGAVRVAQHRALARLRQTLSAEEVV